MEDRDTAEEKRPTKAPGPNEPDTPERDYDSEPNDSDNSDELEFLSRFASTSIDTKSFCL